MINVMVLMILGVLLGSVAGCIPGLHVYNVLAILFLSVTTFQVGVDPEMLIPFVTALVVAYSMVNTIPSILLAAPDESAFFTVLPGQKSLMRGRGFEGVMITALGGLAGLFVLVVFVGPVAPRILPVAREVFRPHQHWILWCVISFMLLSEWPKESHNLEMGARRLLAGWRSLSAGLLTFLLSGLLGFLIMYRSPIPHGVAFQNLMPAFVGLFTVPWLLLNMISRVKIPVQDTKNVSVGWEAVAHGSLAGTLGGGFAAFFPVITGGVGGFLAGHASAIRNDRAFLVSQGASKMIYYVGGLLFFFVPGLRLTRGGAAWMLQGWLTPGTRYEYYMVLAVIAFSGALSFLLMSVLAKGTIRLIGKCDYRWISGAAFALVVIIVLGITGWQGLVVAWVGGCIGLIPVLFGSRRMNCLGIILLPLACNMSGVGGTVAGWLGLL